MLRENNERLDASFLQVLLQVQQVFVAFLKADESLLRHLMHSPAYFEKTKATHSDKKNLAE